MRFGAGADTLTVRLAAGGRGNCAPRLRLDSPDGPVAATLPVRGAGGTDSWRKLSVRLPVR
ncbi:carbohydrate-binding protein [Streptomyces antimycoticus]|uniref:hypothetical protein n=1 Tax=Streptomyces antimycoticus TaxID=68175 RepID=UPI003829127C